MIIVNVSIGRRGMQLQVFIKEQKYTQCIWHMKFITTKTRNVHKKNGISNLNPLQGTKKGKTEHIISVL
jgi:hypothetical protein